MQGRSGGAGTRHAAAACSSTSRRTVSRQPPQPAAARVAQRTSTRVVAHCPTASVIRPGVTPAQRQPVDPGVSGLS